MSQHWIRFVLMDDVPPNIKTERWHVVSNSEIGVLLGAVKWYGPWLKYSFFPNRDSDLLEVTDLSAEHLRMPAGPKEIAQHMAARNRGEI